MVKNKIDCTKKLAIKRRRLVRQSLGYPPLIDPTFTHHHFEHRKALKRYEDSFASRGVSPGLPVKLSAVEAFGIPKVLSKMKWDKLFANTVPYYKEAVRIFYSNIDVAEDECISSSIFKTPIVLTESNLHEILKIPNTGEFLPYSFKEITSSKKTPKSAFLKAIREDKEVPLGEVMSATNELNHYGHILHRVVSANVCPKAGNSDAITLEALGAMFCMHYGIPLNLPAIILANMRNIALSRTRNLAYGVWLTFIFMAFNVPLDSFHASLAPTPLDKGKGTSKGKGSSKGKAQDASASGSAVSEDISIPSRISAIEKAIKKIEVRQRHMDIAQAFGFKSIIQCLKDIHPNAKGEITESLDQLVMSPYVFSDEEDDEEQEGDGAGSSGAHEKGKRVVEDDEETLGDEENEEEEEEEDD